MILFLVLASLYSAPSFADDTKKEEPLIREDAAENVDNELSKGAKKIKGLLNKQGVDTGTDEPAPAPKKKKKPTSAAVKDRKEEVNETWAKGVDKVKKVLNDDKAGAEKKAEEAGHEGH